MSAELRATLLRVDEDGTLVYSRPTAELQALEPGDVIVSEPCEAAPNGLLRKVVSTALDGEHFVVYTEEAALVEAVHQGEASYTGELDFGNATDVTLLPGGEALGVDQLAMMLGEGAAASGGAAASLQTDSTTTTTTPEEKKEGCKRAGLGVSCRFSKTLWKSDEDDAVQGELLLKGEFSLKPILETSIKIKCDKKVLGVCAEIPDLNFMVKVGMEENASLDLTGRAEWQYSNRWDLARFEFTPITFSIGPVPVVLTPSIVLYLAADGSLKAEADIHVEQGVRLAAGFRYNSDTGFEPISEREITWDADPHFSGDLEAKGVLGVQFSILLYGAIGPFASLEAGPYFHGNLAGIPPDGDLYTLDGCLWLYIGIEDRTVFDLNWRQELYKACVTFADLPNHAPEASITQLQHETLEIDPASGPCDPEWGTCVSPAPVIPSENHEVVVMEMPEANQFTPETARLTVSVHDDDDFLEAFPGSNQNLTCTWKSTDEEDMPPNYEGGTDTGPCEENTETRVTFKRPGIRQLTFTVTDGWETVSDRIQVEVEGPFKASILEPVEKGPDLPPPAEPTPVMWDQPVELLGACTEEKGTPPCTYTWTLRFPVSPEEGPSWMGEKWNMGFMTGGVEVQPRDYEITAQFSQEGGQPLLWTPPAALVLDVVDQLEEIYGEEPYNWPPEVFDVLREYLPEEEGFHGLLIVKAEDSTPDNPLNDQERLLVQFLPSEEPDTTLPSVPSTRPWTYTTYAVDDDDRCVIANGNVRSGPDVGYDKVGELAPAAVLIPTTGQAADDSAGDPWRQIVYNGQEAWISARFLTPNPCYANQPATYSALSCREVPRVYEGPGTAYGLLGTLPNRIPETGTGFATTDDYELKWVQVLLGEDTFGWVSQMAFTTEPRPSGSCGLSDKWTITNDAVGSITIGMDEDLFAWRAGLSGSSSPFDLPGPHLRVIASGGRIAEIRVCTGSSASTSGGTGIGTGGSVRFVGFDPFRLPTGDAFADPSRNLFQQINLQSGGQVSANLQTQTTGGLDRWIQWSVCKLTVPATESDQGCGC